MGRPQSFKEYQEIDLKLGIKSSLPNIKSTLAMYILFWISSGKPSELDYSIEDGDTIACNNELFQSFMNAFSKYIEISETEILNVINKNQLFKSQCEALIVAFELVLKLGKITFTDGRPLSSERTGGKRYNKRITFTSNMDIIDAFISNELVKESAYPILLSWVGLYQNDYDSNVEKSLLRMITAFSENALFLLKNGNDDIIFNLSCIYNEILTNNQCEITSDAEPKGPLRILKSLLADGLIYPISVSNGVATRNSSDLEVYAHRVDTMLSLNTKKVSTQPQNSRTEVQKQVKLGENILLYGVPGAGKSHKIKTEYCNDDNYMERVVFHPDYTYSDFIGQILPTTEGDKISYPFVPGPFTRILKNAVNDSDNNYYLIIEEINRGNAPAIFGDIFQLLDRTNGESDYGISNLDIAKEVYVNENHKVKIPSNLFIIATMNTADQNVFTLDTAFKRRWILESINNSFELDENTKKQGETLLCGTNLTWRKFVEKLNETILESNDNNLSSEDNRLGVFFARGEELTDKKMFAEKVLMYLWNDALKFCDTVYRKKYRAFDELLYDFINDEVNPFSVFAPSFEFDNVKFADSFELTEDDDDIDSITTEQYLHDKNLSYIDLYNNLKTQLQEKVENVSEVATKTYLALRYNTTNIACIRIMQNEIQVCTKEPTLSELKIGSKLSSGYRWSNDYKIILTSENVSQVRDAIINAYGLE